jgi:hypothetical protein
MVEKLNVARPIPRVPPVTSTRFPVKSMTPSQWARRTVYTMLSSSSERTGLRLA